jgi:tetratricopeptide (TPR) repeat protein
MAAANGHNLGHAHDAPELLLARSLAARVIREKGPITVGMRELRDALPDHQRLTLQRRRALRLAFEEVGILASPSLEEAGLDATVKVHLAEPHWRRRFRKWVGKPATAATRRVIALVGFVAAVTSLAVLLPDDSSPSAMSGDVNVLVAPLHDKRPGADGETLAESLSRSLHKVIPPFERPRAPDVQIRGPEETSSARGPHEAAEMAKANGAQIVVYGEVVHRHRDALALPKLFIDPKSLIGAEELGGDYSFLPIDLGRLGPSSSLAGRAEFRAIVANQVKGLAALAIGLGWFDGGRWQEAEHWFKQAREIWPSGARRGLAELFVGNAAGKLGHLSQAEDAYRRAMAELADPDRAILGLAQVKLNRAQGTCINDADVAELRRLVPRFAAIETRARTDTLPGQALRLRASLGEARADLCLDLTGETWRRQDAVEAFRRVLSLGMTNSDSFQAELAEARGGVGLALLQPGVPHSESTYMDARSQYLKARLLTNDQARQEVFAAMIALIESRLHEEEAGGPRRTLGGGGTPGTGTLWKRHDSLPAGVRRQLTGFYGVGDVACNPREPKHPRIEISEWPIVPGAGLHEPELGETIDVCVQGMPSLEPISLAIFGPGGFSRTQNLEVHADSPTQTYASFWLDLSWPSGRYNVIAVQDNISTSLRFRVVKPLHRGVRTAAESRARPQSNEVPVMVIGAPPNRRVPVDVYRSVNDSYTANRYATTFTVSTNADGYGEVKLPIGADDNGGFTMRARGVGNEGERGLYGAVRICNGHVC